jgi:hypothetical protein
VLLDADGKALWTHGGEARINDVAVDDVDGDGKAEILAASDDFNLYCLNNAGRERRNPPSLTSLVHENAAYRRVRHPDGDDASRRKRGPGSDDV